MDLGESLPEAAIRETLEETGVRSVITGLVGTYTDPKHVILYTSDGEARQKFSIVLTGRAVDGEPTPSDESLETRLDGVTVLRTEGLVVAGETTTPYRRYDEPAATARRRP
ncbi:hypothetical protein DQ384_10730 [Sphaerisporangium album]|uniref:Nudix hydrolase domain-containing protein n=1 Tax=Sphaerisporangium album TaxID=509200 RepID=A0A367FMS9_9ACTN|nr:hypothetical protein DQ384_10730 [Sphaerisporangium album]